MTSQQRHHLVRAARAAAARAFLTSPGGTAYGAAVLSVSGQIHQAGQYSSFNHVTNVHAEQAVLVLATMADDPDVLALAVASTGDDPVTRPCGVCRQIMAEHATRTGRDFEVLMAHRHGDGHDSACLSELLPFGWTPGHGSSPITPDLRTTPLRPGIPIDGRPLQAGDHVVLSDGCVALVWDGAFDSTGSLVKIKYAPADAGARRKLPHSYTEPLAYQKELHDLGWDRPTRFGARASVVGEGNVAALLPALPLGPNVGELPNPLPGILTDAGVDLAGLRVSGSRAIGLHRQGSDWDLVVPVASGQLPALREALAAAIERGQLSVPPHSGTWRLLDRIFPGGRSAALAQRRYADTVHSGGVSVALILVPPSAPPVCLRDDWQPAGRAVLHGTVREASAASYKRAEYALEDGEHGLVRVTCFHKSANLLRSGDVLSVRGWLLHRGDQRWLIQLLPQPDGILWWQTAPFRTPSESTL
ncbi:MAG: hypothetical protein U0840_12330 [Gemmataceae bacterium]